MTAFLFVPIKVLMRKCCFIILKKLSIRQRDLSNALTVSASQRALLVTSSITCSAAPVPRSGCLFLLRDSSYGRYCKRVLPYYAAYFILWNTFILPYVFNRWIYQSMFSHEYDSPEQESLYLAFFILLRLITYLIGILCLYPSISKRLKSQKLPKFLFFILSFHSVISPLVLLPILLYERRSTNESC